MNYNVECLVTKLSDIAFVNYVENFDFVCLTETFLDNNFDFNSIFLNHAKYPAPAKKLSVHGRKSGGVLLMVKKQLDQFVKEIKIECDNASVLRLDKCLFGTEKDILLVACYVVPEGGRAYETLASDNGIDLLEEALLQSKLLKDVMIIMCGDFNARTEKYQPIFDETDIATWAKDEGDDDDENEIEYERCSKDSVTNEFGRSLIDMCYMLDLCILNGFCNGDREGNFTFVSHQGSSVVDYFLVSDDLYNQFDMQISDCLFSWHLPVEMRWTRGVKRVEEPPVIHQEEKVFWSEECADQYKTELESKEFTCCLKQALDVLHVDVNDSIDVFVKALYGAAACMVRKVGGRKRECNDWFDNDCRVKKRLVKRSLQSFRRAKTPENITKMKDIYVKERKEYVELRRKKKSEFDNERIKKLKASMNDSKLFWKTIKTVNKRKIVYNEISSAQWYIHFLSVFDTVGNAAHEDDDDCSTTEEHCFEPLFNDAINKDEVLDGIQHLKSGKSSGLDKVIGEMLKNGNQLMVEFLVSLFNVLFERGIFPKDWSKSVIVPIYKKGDTNNTDNYRGIALTSVISKVYTYILNKRLSMWASREEKINEEQAGFRAGYSTLDHIFTLYNLVEKYLLKNTKFYVAFVDFRKAFDSVNRNALWNVLRKTGVNGKLYRALRSIYDSVLACVRDKSIYTDFFECPKGVKQGCLLSPLLFSFFVNELAVEISRKGRHGVQIIPGAIEIFLMLFADDIILLSDSIIGLQTQLNSLKKEADRLGLDVNLDKTNIMVFRKGGYLAEKEKWWYGNLEIKVTNSYKYLGMIFTTKLSLNVGWAETCNKAKRGVIAILKSMRTLNSLDLTLFWKLFDTQVAPILLYASEIWGLIKNDHMEKVHVFAMKRFLNIPLHASNQMMYGETGRHPLYIYAYMRSVKYWLKLLKLPETRLCKQTYLMLKQQMEAGKKNWLSNVKHVLTVNGFGIVWLCGEVADEKSFLSVFKDRLISCFGQNWHSGLETNDLYSWYFSFKSVLEPEMYLQSISNRWHRTHLLRFRTRTLGLLAHKRWFDTDTNDAACPACSDENSHEDESHFIFHCTAYEDIRKQNVLFQMPIAQRRDLTAIISTKNLDVINCFAQFISMACKIRKVSLHKN